MRQLDREVAERTFPRRQVRLPVVVRDMSCELVFGALGTEVVGVRYRSVMAVLSSGRDGREQLALTARESRLAEHDLPVERDRRS